MKVFYKVAVILFVLSCVLSGCLSSDYNPVPPSKSDLINGLTPAAYSLDANSSILINPTVECQKDFDDGIAVDFILENNEAVFFYDEKVKKACSERIVWQSGEKAKALCYEFSWGYFDINRIVGKKDSLGRSWITGVINSSEVFILKQNKAGNWETFGIKPGELTCKGAHCEEIEEIYFDKNNEPIVVEGNSFYHFPHNAKTTKFGKWRWKAAYAPGPLKGWVENNIFHCVYWDTKPVRKKQKYFNSYLVYKKFDLNKWEWLDEETIIDGPRKNTEYNICLLKDKDGNAHVYWVAFWHISKYRKGQTAMPSNIISGGGEIGYARYSDGKWGKGVYLGQKKKESSWIFGKNRLCSDKHGNMFFITSDGWMITKENNRWHSFVRLPIEGYPQAARVDENGFLHITSMLRKNRDISGITRYYKIKYLK